MVWGQKRCGQSLQSFASPTFVPIHSANSSMKMTKYNLLLLSKANQLWRQAVQGCWNLTIIEWYLHVFPIELDAEVCERRGGRGARGGQWSERVESLWQQVLTAVLGAGTVVGLTVQIQHLLQGEAFLFGFHRCDKILGTGSFKTFCAVP